MSKIVLASANKDKLRELKNLINHGEIVAIGELIPGWDVEETGLTLEENALLKAKAAAEATNRVSIADDTGLFVWALGGAPGVYTARYAGESCSYSDNTAKLLNALSGEKTANRKASFKTVIAMVTPDGEEHIFSGSVEGFITEELQGTGGFGYDPVFYSSELGKTFAESTPEEKGTISHRGRAMKALTLFLEKNK